MSVKGAENTSVMISDSFFLSESMTLQTVSNFHYLIQSYVGDVMFQPSPPLMELVEGSTSTNCPVEKQATEQLWFKIEPQTDTAINPTYILEMTKRVMFCTSCGNSRLVN